MGLTQRELALKAGVSPRCIKDVEAGKSARPRTFRGLAEALGVRVAQLVVQNGAQPIEEERPPFIIEGRLPPIGFDRTMLRLWHNAMDADMNGDYHSAVGLLKELKAKQANTRDSQAEIVLKLATVLDNAGKPKEAIEELERVIKSDPLRRMPPEIFDWIRYHLALAYRRLAEKETPLDIKSLNNAQTLFQKICASTRNEYQRTACKHQLGVIWWLKSRQPGEKRHAARDRSLARTHFMEAAESWRKHTNFREGYSLRRLAALEFAEGKPKKEVEMLLDSLEIFARHGCEKYRKEVRAQLLQAFAQIRDYREQAGA